jgi:hypothetical protein
VGYCATASGWYSGFCGKDPCCRPSSSLDARFTGRHSGKGNVGIVVHSRTCLHCMMLHVTERRLERSQLPFPPIRDDD